MIYATKSVGHMTGTQKRQFQETLNRLIEERGLISLQEFRDEMERMFPGFPDGTITGYQNMRRPDNQKNPVFGENAREYSEIRKTWWQSLNGGSRQTGFFLSSFDEEISKNDEYYSRIYYFSEEELEESVRAKPEDLKI